MRRLRIIWGSSEAWVSVTRSKVVKQRVSTVITDLDNTLFDWVAIWHHSFKAMLDRLVEDSGIRQDILEGDFKEIFQRHGTSEYAFAIEELPSLRKLHATEDL